MADLSDASEIYSQDRHAQFVARRGSVRALSSVVVDALGPLTWRVAPLIGCAGPVAGGGECRQLGSLGVPSLRDAMQQEDHWSVCQTGQIRR